jgi:hypothetical protein
MAGKLSLSNFVQTAQDPSSPTIDPDVRVLLGGGEESEEKTTEEKVKEAVDKVGVDREGNKISGRINLQVF